MKFIQSMMVIALLFAASTEAIRVDNSLDKHCKGKCKSEHEKEENADNAISTKAIKKAMDKYVAKHEEIANRQTKNERTSGVLEEVEEKMDKDKAAKKEKKQAKSVKHTIEKAEEKEKEIED